MLLVMCLQQEGEVGALTRRIQLLEVDYEQTSGRLTTATEKLDEASKHAEEAERSRNLILIIVRYDRLTI